MSTVEIISTHTRWAIEMDGKRYEVTHYVWRDSQWREAGESWTVLSAVGIHSACHVCDPEKPTHKRVVAAMKVASCAVEG